MKIQTDQEWFSTLFLTHYGTLLNIGALLLNNRSTAEDLVNETFLILWSKRARLRKHPDINGWLYITLKNLIYNETRLSKYQKETPLIYETDTSVSEEQEVSLSDLLPRELSAQERQILVMHFEEELSYEEMAQQLGISILACRTRLCRSKAHYKKIIGKNKKITKSCNETDLSTHGISEEVTE